MRDDDVAELFRILSRLWEEYAKQKDFGAVLELSMASRLLFRALPGAKAPEESALAALYQAIEMQVFEGQPSTKTEAAEPSCSFCGRSPPEVRLGAGSNVYICDGCVSDFASVFRDREE